MGPDDEAFKTVRFEEVECRRCGISVARSEAEVRRHLADVHSITLEDYEHR